MKVYLDDVRPTPSGWAHARWPEDVIKLLKEGNVEEISLDHDLGDFLIPERTGYDVLVWMEEQVVNGNFVPPKINIHTGNFSARLKMELAKKSIEKIYKRKMNEH